MPVSPLSSSYLLKTLQKSKNAAVVIPFMKNYLYVIIFCKSRFWVINLKIPHYFTLTSIIESNIEKSIRLKAESRKITLKDP